MACQIISGKIEPCKGMQEVLQPFGGRGTRKQGAELQTLTNMNTGEFSRQWIVLKSGKHGKTGIIMNNCPFCGGTIFRDEAKQDTL